MKPVVNEIKSCKYYKPYGHFLYSETATQPEEWWGCCSPLAISYFCFITEQDNNGVRHAPIGNDRGIHHCPYDDDVMPADRQNCPGRRFI